MFSGIVAWGFLDGACNCFMMDCSCAECSFCVCRMSSIVESSLTNILFVSKLFCPAECTDTNSNFISLSFSLRFTSIFLACEG